MGVKLKPIEQQVILITGASSGIGLLTAQTAASLGAKVILLARNEEALNNAAADIVNAGGEAIAVVADVADKEAFRAAVDKGIARFGRIDTWVNDAGVGMWGKVTEDHLEDEKRLFETNFWGVVHGSRLAVEYLRDNGGAILNLGSVVSDVAIPPQGMYSASKHAVLGFTDALRIELKNAGLPISVTLIKPAAINTPFPQNAQNYFDKEASLPPPVYDPHIVASAILFAATHSRRELHAGGGGRFLSMLQREVPGVMDLVLSTRSMFEKNFADRPERQGEGALYAPKVGGETRGKADQDRMIRQHSAYNTVAQHPVISSSVVTLAIAGVVAYLLLKDDEPETWTSRLGRYGEDVRDRAGRYGKYATKYASQYADRYGSVLRDHGSTLRDHVSSLSGRASEVGEDLSDRASSYGHDTLDRLTSGASHLASSARHLASGHLARGATHLTKGATNLTRGASSLLGHKRHSWW